MNNRWAIWKRILAVAGLVVLVVVGMSVRRGILAAQRELVGPDIPFTLESALEFRLIEQAYETGALADVDHEISPPEGIVVRETYSVGAEQVYARLARLFPDDMPLAERVRWIETGWFCLGIPLLALWVWCATGSAAGAAVSGLFYAVALSSVIRSAGQEVSRENFALPLLLGHLALDAAAARATRPARFWIVACVSGWVLAAAATMWDLVQFYVILWAVWGWVSLFRGGFDEDRRHWQRWLVQWGMLVLVSLANPYLRSHRWLFSPGMLIGSGVVLGWIWRTRAEGRWARRKWVGIAITLLPLVLGWVCARGYAGAYGHFIELIVAKIRFLNRKPLDPSLLTFGQRIMVKR